MPTAAKGVQALYQPLRPSFWFGPIFDKELRVTARRRRHYVLRWVYGLLINGIVYITLYAGGTLLLLWRARANIKRHA